MQQFAASLFILASVLTQQIKTEANTPASTTIEEVSSTGNLNLAHVPTLPPSTMSTNRTTTTNMNITTTTSSSNSTSSNSSSTVKPSKTVPTSQKPTMAPPESKGPTQTMRPNKTTAPKGERNTAGTDSIGIIIIILIVIVAVGFAFACYVARKRGRRYSVDFNSRPDDQVNIPLSTVEPQLPTDDVPPNGLQTFESLETTTQEQELEAKAEAQEEPKTEADKPAAAAADPSPESAFPPPPPEDPESKPKDPEPVEPSPPAPVQSGNEEKTDDEAVVSNKTSVESLKETNVNNSNNAEFSQKTVLEPSDIFWDIHLDSPM